MRNQLVRMVGLFALVFASVADGSARAQPRCAADLEQVRVLVQDLDVGPAFSSRATGLGQVVSAEAARVKGYAVLSADEVRSALSQEAENQLMGCSAQSCLAEIAEALDADLVVSGRVDAASDGAVLVSLSLLNSRAVVTMNRVALTWRGADSELPEVMRAAAQLLMLEPEQRPPGSIQLVGLPSEARIFLDGEERTRDHQSGRLGGIEIGPHEVRAEASGTEPAVAFVVVKAGQQTAITLELVPVGIPTAAWVLGGVGAVALGGAAAIGVAYALGKSDVAVTAQVPAFGVNDVEPRPVGKP